MTGSSMHRALVGAASSVLALAACTSVPTPDEAVDETSAEWRDRQGTVLQAPLDEGVAAYLPRPGVINDEDPVTAAGERIASLFIDRATLVPAAISGARLPAVGATFVTRNHRTGERGRLRIVGSRPHVSRTGALPAGETDYFVMIERRDASGATTWAGLCPDPAATHLASSARPNLPALPLRGAWDASGAKVSDAGYVTFACTSGAVVKCTDWGYKPWAGPVSPTLGAATYADYHQACLRMALADYCGDGESRTTDGTQVDFYDDRGINRPDTTRRPGEPEMYFEAGWRPNGAACLTKLRWSTLPLGGLCPAKLADPRLVPGALYCDDPVVPAPPGSTSPGDPATALPPILYSRSFENDAALYTWRNARGVTYTTSKGTYGGTARPADTRAPLTGFTTTASGFEGAVYSVNGPASGRPAGAVPLYAYEGLPATLTIPSLPGSPLAKPVTFTYFTGTAPPKGASFKVGIHVGYILPATTAPRPAGSRELRVYYSASTRNYLTTTRVPGGDYTFYRLEGYLPR